MVPLHCTGSLCCVVSVYCAVPRLIPWQRGPTSPESFSSTPPHLGQLQANLPDVLRLPRRAHAQQLPGSIGAHAAVLALLARVQRLRPHSVVEALVSSPGLEAVALPYRRCLRVLRNLLRAGEREECGLGRRAELLASGD
eukprot:scaffold1962_cov241-Pinguiococcus_pyrenoidosus.AAC.6